jgi:hypothetical protein
MQKNLKIILQIAGFSILFLFIFIYAFFRSKDLIFGIKIKDVNITDDAKMTSNVIKVTGNAKTAKNITLNGREISINENGDFNETVALLSGYNIINITAKDKFGCIDEKNYKLIY